MMRLTLNVSNALLQNLLQHLWVFQLLLDLGNDALCQLLLLTLLHLAFIPDPGLENILGLSGQCGPLFELVSLGLELSGLLLRLLELALPAANPPPFPRGGSRFFFYFMAGIPYLGHLKQRLRDFDDATQLLDGLDTVLDGERVVRASSIEDAADLVVLRFSPARVHGPAVLDETRPDAQQAKGNNSLLIEDVVLVADGVDAEARRAREDCRLRHKVAAGKRVQDRLRLRLRVLRRQVR